VAGPFEGEVAVDRFLAALSRFVVRLTWAILLGVVVFVVYLAMRYAG